MNGLERHPHLADAHDLYARILTDKHDYERAFDEWDMAVRIAPNHTGALKGLAFLYFKVGDLAQAEAHLENARKVEPDDPSIDQAIAMMRRGVSPPSPAPTAEHAPSSAATPAATARSPPHRSTKHGCSPVSRAATKVCCSSMALVGSWVGHCAIERGAMSRMPSPRISPAYPRKPPARRSCSAGRLERAVGGRAARQRASRAPNARSAAARGP